MGRQAPDTLVSVVIYGPCPNSVIGLYWYALYQASEYLPIDIHIQLIDMSSYCREREREEGIVGPVCL